MSDEEKSIEEIIAELETLEKEAKEEEKKQAVQGSDEMPEELSLDEPREDVSSDEPPVAAQAEQFEYEEIFMDESPEKSGIEIEIEELSDDISPAETVEGKPSDTIQPGESTLGELSLEENSEELSLEEPTEIEPRRNEDTFEFSLESDGEEKREETKDSEIDLETEELSLEEGLLEKEEETPTVDVSSELVEDEESFETLEMERDADEVTAKEPSFDDAFSGSDEERLSEAREDEGTVFGDQTVKLTAEEMNVEQTEDDTDIYLSDEEFSEELPAEDPLVMSSGGEPPGEPPTDEIGGFPPDEPPMPPPKAKVPLSRVAVLLSLFLVSVILYGIFVWPKLYEYRTVKSGDVKYQVKINRITKTQQYFDAGSWHRGSIPKQISQVARRKIEPKPAAGMEDAKTVVKEPITPPSTKQEPASVVAKTDPHEQTEAREKTVEEAASEVQAVNDEEKAVETATEPSEIQSKISEKTEEPAGVEEVKKPEPEKAEKIVTATVPAEKEAAQTKKYIKAEPTKTKQYVIQLSCMRFEEFADELVTTLKKKGWIAHKDSVMGKDKEPWHRVFLGGFEERGEAVTFMKEKNIKKMYPGSFVRSMYLSAATRE